MNTPVPTSLRRALTKHALASLAGATIYQRGAHYQQLGAVLDLQSQRYSLSASVAGANHNEYTVQLWGEGGQLGFGCTCPMGQKGVPCKHVVAAGLAWIHSNPPPPSTRGNVPPHAK